MSRNLKLLIFALAVFVCIAGAMLFLCSSHPPPDPLNAQPFDAAVWAKSNPEERAAMARDTMRHISVGMSEAEVISLLGKPYAVDDTRKLNGTGPAGQRTYSYWLGSWSREYFDDTFLWINIGTDGHVVSVEIGGG